MALQATDLTDITNLTLAKYGRMKITDLMSDYNKTIAFKKLFKKKKMSFDGGTQAVFNLQTDDNGSFRMVGYGATDVVDIPNVTAQGSVPWRGATWNWAVEHALATINSGSAEKLFDWVQSQRIAAAASAVKGVETRFWRCPSANSTTEFYGLEYWIVKNGTAGFNGTVGTGFSVVGNLSPTTYTRWRNYTAPYSAISKADAVKALRKAMWETDFDLLVDETPTYNTGDDPEMYTNYSVWSTLQDLGEAQNDNLGSDLASMDGEGKITFRGRPITAVKELENDSTNPIWGVNWGELFAMALEGWWMRETQVPIKSDQHTVSVTHVDCKFNLVSRNRRRHFVLSNGTTQLA